MRSRGKCAGNGPRTGLQRVVLRLRQLDDPRVVAALIRLPGEMFADAVKCASPTKGKALAAPAPAKSELR